MTRVGLVQALEHQHRSQAIATGQVSVGVAPTLIANARADRKRITIVNTGAVAVDLGNSNVTAGRVPLYPIELIKLCHALDVRPEWLLCWERRVH